MRIVPSKKVFISVPDELKKKKKKKKMPNIPQKHTNTTGREYSLKAFMAQGGMHCETDLERAISGS